MLHYVKQIVKIRAVHGRYQAASTAIGIAIRVSLDPHDFELVVMTCDVSGTELDSFHLPRAMATDTI